MRYSMQILLAEDDQNLGALVKKLLEKKGNYQVDWVDNGDDALFYAESTHYDVVILDWMMPGLTGIEVCQTLRNQGYQNAIIMLTAKDDVNDRVQGLDSGADDYLVKPFESSELLARIRTLLRRNFSPIIEDFVTIHDFKLNRTDMTLIKNKSQITLTQREFQLLDLLEQNKGIVLSRDQLLERIWGIDSDVTTKIVDATVKLLRKKLNQVTEHEIIISVRGVGYKMNG